MNNDKKPLVCVVMPILNEVKYIDEAVQSLLQQDYKPIEVIVYDGGSTDGTLDILRKYPLNVIVEPGLGQMAAINRGWELTKAEYVIWMAGDDRYKPGAIRNLVDGMHTYPEAGVVFGDTGIIDEKGNTIGNIAPGNIQFRDLVFSLSFAPQSALIRKSTLKRAGMMDEKRKFAADYDLFLRIAQYYSLGYIPYHIADIRIHSESEDFQNKLAVADAAIDVIDSFFKRNDLSNNQYKLRYYGKAGSRIFASRIYYAANKRREAWDLLGQALIAEPLSTVFCVIRIIISRLCRRYKILGMKNS